MAIRVLLLLLAVSFHVSADAQVKQLSPRDVDVLPVSAPTLTSHYGPGALQFGELRLPAGRGPFPTAVVIHGGCWTNGYATLRNTAPMASALTAKGIATWNIEYRQGGDNGGGWPGTFKDWGAATDHLRTLAKTQPLDLNRVVTVGHSAGAHAALWIAARGKLPDDSELASPDALPVKAAVAIDGPPDLAAFIAFDEGICGKPVIAPFMGGTPKERPARYRDATSQSFLPLGVSHYLVASSVLSPEDAEPYRQKAVAGGDRVDIMLVPGITHFNLIAPGQSEWAMVESLIVERVFGTLSKPEAGDLKTPPKLPTEK